MIYLIVLDIPRRTSWHVIRLKCDREHPCETCRRRGESCTYVTFNNLSRPSRSRGPDLTTASNVQEDIIELEQQPTLDNTRSTSPQVQGSKQFELPRIPDHEPNSPGLGNPPPFPTRFGRMNLSDTETTYVGSSHWTAILQEVNLLQISLNDCSKTKWNFL